MRRRLAGLVLCLSSAAVLLPASPAAARGCTIDNVKDLVPCVTFYVCRTGICP
ncbi:MAG TPA: hypothetical protein VHN37_10785 [Actinomycetota bacterium]|nr:hypothetical protein [Actinomycetota bacterium]